jgi:hypothetical protein
MNNNQELPIELECWLIRHGILESEYAPGAHRHAPIARPRNGNTPAPAWKPEFAGQEPPF